MKQRFSKMEELAEAYGIDLAVTQTQNASMMTGTQGTSASDTVMTGGSQDSVISISDEDMRSFMVAVARKQTELSEKLKHHKFQSQSAEDLLTASLSDLLAKQKSIDNGKLK
jgi:hypothetical protein